MSPINSLDDLLEALTVLGLYPGGGGGGGGTPGGASTQIQYNAAGSFGGVAGFTWATSVLSLTPTGRVVITPTVAGTIDNMAIGQTTAAAGKFTVLQATTSAALSPANGNIVISPTGTGSVTLNPATAGTMDNIAVGLTTPLAGKFTTLSASSTVSGTGFSTYLASPPAIGITTAAAGTFTVLQATASAALSPANGNIVISPTGTGTVTVNPATAGTIDNVAIGTTTALTVKGTTITATTAFAGANSGLLTQPSAARWQFGAADAAAPVAQTISVQSVVGGTANTAGVDRTVVGSLSTGTGVSGNLVYQTSFSNLNTNFTVTISNASPAVITKATHGLVPGSVGQFTTTGTLPTGLSLATNYYVIAAGLAAGSFEVSATPGGAAINTSSAGSGTHTFTTQTGMQNPASSVLTIGPSALTGSQTTPAASIVVIWNTSGAATALKLNVTNTASAAASLLMDLQVGGTSQFKVSSGGVISTPALGAGNYSGTSTPAIQFGSAAGLVGAPGGGTGIVTNAGSVNLIVTNSQVYTNGGSCFGWDAGTYNVGPDTCFWRTGVKTVALGSGTQGDFSGSLKLTTLNSVGAVQAFSATATPAGGTAGAGVLFGATANFGIFFGSGVPTLSAAQGSLYLRSDGSSVATRLYINTTGGTTWTNVVTAA